MKKPPLRETILFFLCVFLGFLVFYLLMLNKWGINPFNSPFDYTRFGTWSNAISGCGTTLAVIIALASLYSQRSIYRSGENRRLLEEETGVFLWLTHKEVRNSKDELVGRIWDLRVLNSTKAPIYRWKVTFGGEHLCNLVKRPLLPGESNINIFNMPAFDNLAPDALPEPILHFEGKSGRFWARSARGVLEEIEAKDIDCPHTQSLDK